MNLQPFVEAWQDKHWVLFGALLVGAVIALTKQGWLSTWLAEKIPSRFQPLLAMGLGVATLLVADIQAGKTWQEAVIDGLSAAFTAIVGHETLIEGLRGGREIVPETIGLKKVKADRTTAPPPPPAATT
jgi:hypothetical protein